MEQKKELGLIHVYTGDGKGKTTAAIGLATRALGKGLKVCYCSFHKCPEKYGYTEMESLRKLGATVHNFAKGHPHLDRTLDENVIRREANEAFDTLAKELESTHYDLMILDESIISVRDHYIEEEVLLNFVQHVKPTDMELVLTGRSASDKLMALADYVTFCKKVKHPYDEGITSRAGIEY